MELTQQAVLDALATVPDPEIGLGIVDLGLVYNLQIQDHLVRVEMTMTTPACPLHAQMREAVQQAVLERFPEVKEVRVELVWEPPWSPQLMSSAARHALGWSE